MNAALVVFVGATALIMVIGGIMFAAGCYRIITSFSKKKGTVS